MNRRTSRQTTRADSGFTLVELLVTMTLISIVTGMAYSSFQHALRSYQEGATRVGFGQNLRMGLAELTRDISNGIADADDEALAVFIEDVPGEVEGEDYDMISFVAHVAQSSTPEEEVPLSPLPPSLRLGGSSSLDEELADEGAASDLIRIAYMVGPDPLAMDQEAQADGDESAPQSLLRVTTPTLDLEEAFGDALGMDPVQMVSTLQELGATVDAVIDGVSGLNFGFFDGEEWWDEWDVEEQGAPAVVRVALSVREDDDDAVSYTQSSAARFMASPGGTATEGGQPGQGQGQQGPGQGGPGGPPGGA
jgi:prepilin-type N-terminal cleavage/methylation domain-containing protein